jgi:hypothetical protein
LLFLSGGLLTGQFLARQAGFTLERILSAGRRAHARGLLEWVEACALGGPLEGVQWRGFALRVVRRGGVSGHAQRLEAKARGKRERDEREREMVGSERVMSGASFHGESSG